MTELTSEQYNELLQIIADAISAHNDLGNASAYVSIIQEWMETNAPSYLAK